MQFRSKILILVLLLILIWSFVGYLPNDGTLLAHYNKNVFAPYQTFRGGLFSHIPFSIGDLLYLFAGLGLLFIIGRWVYSSIKTGIYTAEIAGSLLNTINTLLLIYLIFIISWGGNYYKPSLSKYWGLEDNYTRRLREKEDSDVRRDFRIKDSTALVAFDLFLIDKLNELAPYYAPMSFNEINKRAGNYYNTYTDDKVREFGLWTKPSLFSYLIERIGVDGYYNPFTGEGQVNTELPSFIMPFVVCHEIAHQAGIAAEGDANLLSYTLCTTTADTTFKYSAYLDIWVYTNNRIYVRDSLLAHRLEDRLNELTASHLDTLEQFSRKYHNGFARFSSKLYDGYLKMENQKEGIRSYGDVAISAWQVEQIRRNASKGVIELP